MGLTARLARVSSMRRRSIGPACCSILGYGSLTEGSESGWGWGVGGGGSKDTGSTLLESSIDISGIVQLFI